MHALPSELRSEYQNERASMASSNVLGDIVGASVGLGVGDLEGFLVGLSVGESVGFLLGLPVGETVGFFEGVKLGDSVGAVVHAKPFVVQHSVRLSNRKKLRLASVTP